MSQLNSLSDYLPLLNQQLSLQWTLFDYHRQLSNLLRPMLKIDFLSEPKTVLFQYLQVLASVVKEAKSCNVDLLSRLIHAKELLIEFDDFPE